MIDTRRLLEAYMYTFGKDMKLYQSKSGNYYIKFPLFYYQEISNEIVEIVNKEYKVPIEPLNEIVWNGDIMRNEENAVQDLIQDLEFLKRY